MKSNSLQIRALAATCLLALIPPTTAHTWVEEIRLIASNGSYTGAAGFPRAFSTRAVKGGDNNLHTIVGNIASTVPMCATAQTVGTQSAGFNRLKAAANDHIALRYEENGHVTVPGSPPGKPAGRGTVFIYGTKDPKNTDTLLGIHGQWNADGSGGDKRGKLIATRNFDDGKCFQAGARSAIGPVRAAALSTNGNTEVFCQNDIQLPADMGTSGTYALYWVWDWPTLWSNGALNSNEIYTSCIDIDVVSTPVPAAGSFSASQSGANINSAAIAEQMNKAFIVDPTKPFQVASDTIGPVQPAGDKSVPRVILTALTGSGSGSGSLPATSAVGSSSAAKPSLAPSSSAAKASSAPAPSAKTSTTQTQASSSIAQAPKLSVTPSPNSGFRTVTVAMPTTIEKTVTVFMPEPSSASAPSKPKASAGVAENNTGGVFVSIAPSSTTAAFAPVSTASGLYTTGTTVPTPQPFLKKGATIRGRRWW